MTIEQSGISGELRDRLAARLERLVPPDEHYPNIPLPSELRGHARRWADRCLSDANAAVKLVEEQGWPAYIEFHPAYQESARWTATLYPKRGGVWHAAAPTAPHALCAAFVAAMEASDE